MKRLWLVLGLVVASVPAMAQDRSLQGITGRDDRTLAEPKLYPWSAVGRLNNSIGGHCSGALVGPDLVVTAAHCLHNHKTNRQIPDSSLTFVAGYDRGQYLAASKVKSVTIAPGWVFGRKNNDRATDWALLKLADKLGDQVGWVALGLTPQPGGKVSLVGYGKDKAHLPLVHRGCQILKRYGQLLLNDCDAVQGASGGPMLAAMNGQVSLMGLGVAALPQQQGLGLAVGVEAVRPHALQLGGRTQAHVGPMARPMSNMDRAALGF